MHSMKAQRGAVALSEGGSFLSPPIRAGTPPLSERDQEGGQECTREAPFKCKKSHAGMERASHWIAIGPVGVSPWRGRGSLHVRGAPHLLPHVVWHVTGTPGLPSPSFMFSKESFVTKGNGIAGQPSQQTKPKPGNSLISSNLWGLVNYRISIL